jgi:hypothetical protein
VELGTVKKTLSTYTPSDNSYLQADISSKAVTEAEPQYIAPVQIQYKTMPLTITESREETQQPLAETQVTKVIHLLPNSQQPKIRSIERKESLFRQGTRWTSLQLLQSGRGRTHKPTSSQGSLKLRPKSVFFTRQYTARKLFTAYTFWSAAGGIDRNHCLKSPRIAILRRSLYILLTI